MSSLTGSIIEEAALGEYQDMYNGQRARMTAQRVRLGTMAAPVGIR